MSLYLPEELRWLGWVAGAAWPDGDEDLAWETSKAWEVAAAEITALLAKLDEAKRLTMSAYPQGVAAEEMGARYDVLRTGDQSLEALAQAMQAVADSAFDMGTELQATKITIIVTLCWLAAEIAWAWLFPPTAPATEAAAILTTRSVLKVMQDTVQKTIANLAARMGAPTVHRSFWKSLAKGKFVAPTAKGWGVYGARAGEAVAIAGGINASVQVGQIADGKRREFNGKEFGFSVLGGVAGALPAREFGRGFGHLFDKVGDKVIAKTGWNPGSTWYGAFRGGTIGALADGFGAVAGNLAVGVAHAASGGNFSDAFLSGEGWAGGFIQGGLVGGMRGGSVYSGYIPKVGEGITPGQYRRDNPRGALWFFPKSAGQGFFAPKPGATTPAGHTDGSTGGTTGTVPAGGLPAPGTDGGRAGLGHTAPPPLMSGALGGSSTTRPTGTTGTTGTQHGGGNPDPRAGTGSTPLTASGSTNVQPAVGAPLSGTSGQVGGGGQFGQGNQGGGNQVGGGDGFTQGGHRGEGGESGQGGNVAQGGPVGDGGQFGQFGQIGGGDQSFHGSLLGDGGQQGGGTVTQGGVLGDGGQFGQSGQQGGGNQFGGLQQGDGGNQTFQSGQSGDGQTGQGNQQGGGNQVGGGNVAGQGNQVGDGNQVVPGSHSGGHQPDQSGQFGQGSQQGGGNQSFQSGDGQFGQGSQQGGGNQSGGGDQQGVGNRSAEGGSANPSAHGTQSPPPSPGMTPDHATDALDPVSPISSTASPIPLSPSPISPLGGDTSGDGGFWSQQGGGRENSFGGDGRIGGDSTEFRPGQQDGPPQGPVRTQPLVLSMPGPLPAAPLGGDGTHSNSPPNTPTSTTSESPANRERRLRLPRLVTAMPPVAPPRVGGEPVQTGANTPGRADSPTIPGLEPVGPPGGGSSTIPVPEPLGTPGRGDSPTVPGLVPAPQPVVPVPRPDSPTIPGLPPLGVDGSAPRPGGGLPAVPLPAPQHPDTFLDSPTATTPSDGGRPETFLDPPTPVDGRPETFLDPPTPAGDGDSVHSEGGASASSGSSTHSVVLGTDAVGGGGTHGLMAAHGEEGPFLGHGQDLRGKPRPQRWPNWPHMPLPFTPADPPVEPWLPDEQAPPEEEPTGEQPTEEQPKDDPAADPQNPATPEDPGANPQDPAASDTTVTPETAPTDPAPAPGESGAAATETEVDVPFTL